MTTRKAKEKLARVTKAQMQCVELNAHFKHKVICVASEMGHTSHIRRPFGHMQLDLDVGGGIPAGGLSTISGADQAGKTELLYYLIAMNQRIHGDKSSCIFAASEGGFDILQARTAGVSVRLPESIIEEKNRASKLFGHPPLTEEEIGVTVGNLSILAGLTGEETLEAVLRAVDLKEHQLILIDSLTALMPEANADREMSDEDKRAAWATMMTKFAAHLGPRYNPIRPPNFTTVVGTQQMRADQERANAATYIQKYLPVAKAKQAWSLRHLTDIRLIISEGSKIKRKIKGKNEVVGKVLKWVLDKGKKGTHNHLSGETTFYFTGFDHPAGVDRLGSITVAGIRYGVLDERKNGIFLRWPREEKLASSMEEFERRMEEDFSFELDMRYFIMGKNGNYAGFIEKHEYKVHKP